MPLLILVDFLCGKKWTNTTFTVCSTMISCVSRSMPLVNKCFPVRAEQWRLRYICPVLVKHLHKAFRPGITTDSVLTWDFKENEMLFALTASRKCVMSLLCKVHRGKASIRASLSTKANDADWSNQSEPVLKRNYFSIPIPTLDLNAKFQPRREKTVAVKEWRIFVNLLTDRVTYRAAGCSLKHSLKENI